MKKVKLASLILTGLIWLLAHNTYANTTISFPAYYFWDNTHIFFDNSSEIRFNQAWYDWFGLFFLGTWKNVNATLNIGSSTITCNKQLNWYYAINFTDFWMFPLDTDTWNIVKNFVATQNVTISTWWLFYDCKNNNNTIITWVYWYIRRTYWNPNSQNTHEIWAWVKQFNSNDYKWTNISPLEITYSTNNRNTNRTLSGNFYSSLIWGSAHNATVSPKFFGDVWISGVEPIWETYTISGSSINNYEIYVKSSLANSAYTWKITRWSQTVQQSNTSLQNTESPYWFHWLHRWQFSSGITTNNWSIEVTIKNSSKTRTKKIYFSIYDDIPPTITINQSAPLQCSLSKTVTGTMNEPGHIKYYKTWTNTCNETIPNSNFIWTDNNTATLTFNQESDNWTYVCFKGVDTNWNTTYKLSEMITGIDNQPPTIQQIKFLINNQIQELTGNEINIWECTTWTIRIERVHVDWCATLPPQKRYWRTTTHNNEYFSNPDNYTSSNTYSMYNWTATDNWTTVKIGIIDTLWQYSTTWVKIKRLDNPITASGREYTIPTPLTGKYSITRDDLINTYFWITWWWTCETITITPWRCSSNATQSYEWDKLTITPSENIDKITNRCDVYFTDGDTTIIWTIKFAIKTKLYYITLKNSPWYSSGRVKYDGQFDTGLVKVKLTSGDTNYHIFPSWYNSEDDTGRYNIEYVQHSYAESLRNPQARYEQFPITVKITDIDINGLDAKYEWQCQSWTFIIAFEEWFVKDPAWIPSQHTGLATNNIYKSRPVLHVSWTNKNHIEWYTIEVLKQSLITWDVKISFYSTKQITEWNDVECIWNNETCPWFSCSSWIIRERWTDGPTNLVQDIDGATYLYKYTVKLDPMVDSWPYEWIFSGDRIIRNDCRIQLISGNCWDYAPVNLLIRTRPYKFWPIKREYFYEDTIWNAVNAWSGDYWFFMYMSNPQEINLWWKTWILWNIEYDINFSSWVADEFYTIQGTGIVNWYQQNLEIKRPTFNYSNPRSYLFNFPYYD